MVRRVRPAAAAVLLFALLSAGGPAHADEQSDLDKGRNAYLSRQYDEADARFKTMLDPKIGTLHDPVLITQAYMYWGAVMVAKGRSREAGALFEQLLLKDPHYEPDPLSFPTVVLDAFTDTRSRIRERLNLAAQEKARRDAERRAQEEAEKRRQAERLVLLEKLAAEERTTERHSRIVASVPFGAGQFQNHDTALGWIFLGAEAALVVAGSVMVPLYYQAQSEKNDLFTAGPLPRTREVTEAAERASTFQTLNRVFYGAFAVAAAIGITHAHLRYQDEVIVVKRRNLPAPPRTTGASPWLGGTPGGVGGLLGVRGRF